MERIIVHGIVLSEIDYKESSKILNIFTLEYGNIGVISKGSKKLKSNLRSISNKLNYCEFTISYKENGLSTLIEGNTINSFKFINSDFKAQLYSMYLIDLTKEILKDNVDFNYKDLYYLLVNSLEKINDKFNPEFIVSIFELKLLRYLGIELELNSCISCGSTDIKTIDINLGGLVCKDCYNDTYLFTKNTIKLIRQMYYIDLSKLESIDIPDGYLDEIDKFIDEYYETYTGLYRKNKNNIKRMLSSFT